MYPDAGSSSEYRAEYNEATNQVDTNYKNWVNQYGSSSTMTYIEHELAVDCASRFTPDLVHDTGIMATDFASPPGSGTSLANITYPTFSGGGPLNVRATPTTDSSVKGQVPDGGSVTVTCSTFGPDVQGPQGNSNLWVRLTAPVNDGYISAAFLDVSPTLSIAPPC